MQNQTMGEWEEPEDDEDAEPSIFDMTDRDYLLELRERMRAVPVMYGIDGSDIDRLGEVIGRMEVPAEPECKHDWEKTWGFNAPTLTCKACGKVEHD